MPEKKNKTKKPSRKPEDLRKKYPVDKILSQAETNTTREIAKEFKITIPTIHKIIRRYGSEELKQKVSDRSPQRKKTKKDEEKQKESWNNVQQYMDNLERFYTALQTPTLKLASLDENMTRVTTRLEYMQTSGMELIRLIATGLYEKGDEYTPEKIDSILDLLRDYLKHSLAGDRVLIAGYREQAIIQEKYVKLETVSSELRDTRTLIKVFFNSYNLLNVDDYRRIKEYVTTLAPATETFFAQYESTYARYRAEQFEKAGITGNTGSAETAEAGKEATEGTEKTATDSSGNNKE